jgi:hypothetical protein
MPARFLFSTRKGAKLNTDYVIDYRAQLERRRLEAEQRRSQDILAQRAIENSPEMRVRMWERVHQLRMPRDPAHAILAQIAQQTELPLAEVQAVQRERAALAG